MRGEVAGGQAMCGDHVATARAAQQPPVTFTVVSRPSVTDGERVEPVSMSTLSWSPLLRVTPAAPPGDRTPSGWTTSVDQPRISLHLSSLQRSATPPRDPSP